MGSAETSLRQNRSRTCIFYILVTCGDCKVTDEKGVQKKVAGLKAQPCTLVGGREPTVHIST